MPSGCFSMNSPMMSLMVLTCVFILSILSTSSYLSIDNVSVPGWACIRIFFFKSVYQSFEPKNVHYGSWCRWLIFPLSLQRLSVVFLIHCASLEKDSALHGKKFLTMEQIISFRLNPYRQGRYNCLTEFPPLKVYLFHSWFRKFQFRLNENNQRKYENGSHLLYCCNKHRVFLLSWFLFLGTISNALQNFHYESQQICKIK